MLNKKSNLSIENKLLIYKVIVRSAMVYACPVWSSTCKTNYDKLQIQQNKFLRLTGKYPMYYPVYKIHKELNIEYFSDFVKKLSTDYFCNFKSHCSTLIREINVPSGKYIQKRLMHILK